MKYTIEIDENSIAEQVSKLQTRSSFYGEGLDSVIGEAVKTLAKEEIIKLFKENKALRDELNAAISKGISASFTSYGEKIGDLIVDGIKQSFKYEYNVSD